MELAKIDNTYNYGLEKDDLDARTEALQRKFNHYKKHTKQIYSLLAIAVLVAFIVWMFYLLFVQHAHFDRYLRTGFGKNKDYIHSFDVPTDPDERYSYFYVESEADFFRAEDHNPSLVVTATQNGVNVNNPSTYISTTQIPLSDFPFTTRYTLAYAWKIELIYSAYTTQNFVPILFDIKLQFTGDDAELNNKIHFNDVDNSFWLLSKTTALTDFFPTAISPATYVKMSSIISLPPLGDDFQPQLLNTIKTQLQNDLKLADAKCSIDALTFTVDSVDSKTGGVLVHIGSVDQAVYTLPVGANLNYLYPTNLTPDKYTFVTGIGLITTVSSETNAVPSADAILSNFRAVNKQIINPNVIPTALTSVTNITNNSATIRLGSGSTVRDLNVTYEIARKLVTIFPQREFPLLDLVDTSIQSRKNSFINQLYANNPNAESSISKQQFVAAINAGSIALNFDSSNIITLTLPNGNLAPFYVIQHGGATEKLTFTCLIPSALNNLSLTLDLGYVDTYSSATYPSPYNLACLFVEKNLTVLTANSVNDVNGYTVSNIEEILSPADPSIKYRATVTVNGNIFAYKLIGSVEIRFGIKEHFKNIFANNFIGYMSFAIPSTVNNFNELIDMLYISNNNPINLIGKNNIYFDRVEEGIARLRVCTQAGTYNSRSVTPPAVPDRFNDDNGIEIYWGQSVATKLISDRVVDAPIFLTKTSNELIWFNETELFNYLYKENQNVFDENSIRPVDLRVSPSTGTPDRFVVQIDPSLPVSTKFINSQYTLTINPRLSIREYLNMDAYDDDVLISLGAVFPDFQTLFGEPTTQTGRMWAAIHATYCPNKTADELYDALGSIIEADIQIDYIDWNRNKLIGYADIVVTQKFNSVPELSPVVNGSTIRIYWDNSNKPSIEYLLGNNYQGFIGWLNFTSGTPPSQQVVYDKLANLNALAFSKIGITSVNDFNFVYSVLPSGDSVGEINVSVNLLDAVGQPWITGSLAIRYSPKIIYTTKITTTNLGSFDILPSAEVILAKLINLNNLSGYENAYYSAADFNISEINISSNTARIYFSLISHFDSSIPDQHYFDVTYNTGIIRQALTTVFANASYQILTQMNQILTPNDFIRQYNIENAASPAIDWETLVNEVNFIITETQVQIVANESSIRYIGSVIFTYTIYSS